MNPGPLRRMVGTIGLVALVPVAWQLFTGALQPGAAALRAVVVLGVVVVVGRLTTRYLDSVVRAVEADVGAPARARPRPRPVPVEHVERVEPEDA